MSTPGILMPSRHRNERLTQLKQRAQKVLEQHADDSALLDASSLETAKLLEDLRIY